MRFSRAIIGFLILLLPSAYVAWETRDMPQFSNLHDDGLYLVSAKSLADGSGYRIESLPDAPAQTKYPPLYPWFLSWVWRLSPSYPDNLRLATLFSWILIPVLLVLCRRLYRNWGFEGRRLWTVLGLVAINPPKHSLLAYSWRAF
jgi:hypothetical protein